MKALAKLTLGAAFTALIYTTNAAALDPTNENTNSALQPTTENGVTYLSGGIGESEVQQIKNTAKDYNLMLTFTTQKRGAYLADVTVDIENAKGKNILSAVSQGPIFLADLPNGKYRVKATAEGKVVSKNIYISGKKQVRTALTWPDKLVEGNFNLGSTTP